MRNLLYVIAAILIVLWIVGFMFRYIISPLVHLLLIAAVVILAIRFLSGLSRGGREV